MTDNDKAPWRFIFRWLMVGIGISITLSMVMASPNPIGTFAFFAVIWAVGIFIYRRRQHIKEVMENDEISILELVKSETKPKPITLNSSTKQSNADSDGVSPLSFDEEISWKATVEQFTSTEFDPPFDAAKFARKKKKGNKE